MQKVPPFGRRASGRTTSRVSTGRRVADVSKPSRGQRGAARQAPATVAYRPPVRALLGLTRGRKRDTSFDVASKAESTPPHGDSEPADSFLREVFRRVLETGAKSLTAENLKQAARELRLPKEVLHHLLNQIEEGKNSFYRAAAQEVRGFLERSNLSEEIAKALTRLTFEAKIEVRFRPNDASGEPRPGGVVTRFGVRSADDSSGGPATTEGTTNTPREEQS